MSEWRTIKKSAVQRYTLGVVYEPNVVDGHGDFTSADEIEQACWAFNKQLQAGGHLVKFAKAFLSAVVEASKDDILELEIPDAILTKGMLGVQHTNWSDDIGEIVESYVAPSNFEIEGQSVKKGTWLMGVVWSQENWDRIECGELTGLSLGGTAIRVPEPANG